MGFNLPQEDLKGMMTTFAATPAKGEYSCNYLPDKRNSKRIYGLTPDTESLQYDKKHEKIVRRACSKEEDARLMAAVRNWAAMEGYRIEQDDESEV